MCLCFAVLDLACHSPLCRLASQLPCWICSCAPLVPGSGTFCIAQWLLGRGRQHLWLVLLLLCHLPCLCLASNAIAEPKLVIAPHGNRLREHRTIPGFHKSLATGQHSEVAHCKLSPPTNAGQCMQNVDTADWLLCLTAARACSLICSGIASCYCA